MGAQPLACCCCCLQMPADSDPDVRQRLAGEGLTAALRFHNDMSAPPSDTVPSLAVAAAEHSLPTEATCEELQQELTDLRAHSQQVEARCEVLQEEVVELRAMVGAVFALVGQQIGQQMEQQHMAAHERLTAALLREGEGAGLTGVAASGAQLRSLLQQKERQ